MEILPIIALDRIDASGRIRTLCPDQVEALVDSIASVGLLNPITVTRASTGFRLVAGAHRLEACRRLGYFEIEAIVKDLTELEAVLAECDENLCGTKLTPVERAQFTARRKEVYEALHPEAKHGGDRRSDQVANLATCSFSEDQSNKTGASERTVRRDAERGERVAPEAMQMIRGTKLDSGAYLDRIKTLPPDDQVTTIKRDLSQDRVAERSRPSASLPPDGRTIPTFEELRQAIYLLSDLSVQDYLSICPPQQKAAMCQRLVKLEQVFEAVREEAVR